MTDTLLFIPLGGLGEIGMNLALYGFGSKKNRKWLVVDCGIGFPGPDLPGIDVIMPDPSVFLKEEGGEIIGIVITHAHEDHYGALLDLWPALQAPVYLTEFAASLLKAKMLEKGGALHEIPLNVITPGDRFHIGPFAIETVPMSHSIPEPIALVLHTPIGVVFHSGDWKNDPAPGTGISTDWPRLQDLGEEGIDVLVCDSTNILRKGSSPSESDVAHVLMEVIKKAPRQVFVTAFASNVGRLRAVAQAAYTANRHVILLGRAMKRVCAIAQELGYFKGLPDFLTEDSYDSLPPEKRLILCTGSQGEPRAALPRLALTGHKRLKLHPEDTVIFSSRTIPGNERSVAAVLNALSEKNVDVITDQDALVHVSGHPRQDELRALYKALKPRHLLPVHGEALHLARHRDFAHAEGLSSVLVCKNGDVATLLPGVPKKLRILPSSLLVQDGKIRTSIAESGVKLRRKMSFSGVVVVSLVLNTAKELLSPPHVCALGIPEHCGSRDHIEDVLEELIDAHIATLAHKKRHDLSALTEEIRHKLRSYLFRQWGKKPVCEVLIEQI